jgi:hypothetical protein
MPAVQTLGPQASSLLPGNKFSGDCKKDDLRLNLQFQAFYMSPRWGWYIFSFISILLICRPSGAGMVI